MHLALMHKLVGDFRPQAVVVDPISNFISSGTMSEAGAMLVRLVDFLKRQGITSLFTNLTHGGSNPEYTDVGISSIIDTWLLLRDAEHDGERSGVVYVLKSRGMAHSKQVKGFRLTDNGIELAEAEPAPNRPNEVAATKGGRKMKSRGEPRTRRSGFLGFAPVCGRADGEIRRGLRQPQAGVRGTSGGEVPDRGHRFVG